MTDLVVDSVVKRFGGLVAVDRVSLTVPAGGRIIGLMGPNGAGKTTLFNCITGNLRPDEGDVRLGDRSILGLKPHQRANLGIARTFQRLAVFDTMTVTENIQVAVETRTPGRLIKDMFRVRHPVDAAVAGRTEELLELTRLTHVRNELVGGMPTGVSRLVELARALAIGPSFVLLDEPASGLDTGETKYLETVLQDVADAGVSLLLVEHDVDLVLRLCEEIHVTEFGRQIASGTPEQIAADQRVRAAYLGQTDGVADVASA